MIHVAIPRISLSVQKGNLKASLVVRPYTKPLTRLSQIIERDYLYYAATNFEARFLLKSTL